MRSSKGRLEPTWMSKDMALIPSEDAKTVSGRLRDQRLASANLRPSMSAEPKTTRLFVAT